MNEIIETYGLDCSRIYNCDEIGMKTVKYLHEGEKQIGAKTSAERGTIVVVCATNACGHYIPSMSIFPHKQRNCILMDHAQPCSKGNGQESGRLDGQTNCSLSTFRWALFTYQEYRCSGLPYRKMVLCFYLFHLIRLIIFSFLILAFLSGNRLTMTSLFVHGFEHCRQNIYRISSG